MNHATDQRSAPALLPHHPRWWTRFWHLQNEAAGYVINLSHRPRWWTRFWPAQIRSQFHGSTFPVGAGVSIDTLTGSASPVAARLLIHAKAEIGAGGNIVATLWLRLRAWISAGQDSNERDRITLTIEDAQGSPVLATEDAEPLIDVLLPPGTYHITAHRGEVRRGYTMTLTRGASVDLHLRLTPGRR